jgi:arsenite methyltransferase
MAEPSARRANYGIDAPTVVVRFLAIGVVGILAWAGILFLPFHRWLGFVAGPLLGIGVTYFAIAIVMLWGSKVGKLRLRDRVIGSIPWRGDEMVLDVGCGHGLMLIAAAKKLRTGKAIGIDLWQSVDQAGNSREATLENVRLEGVNDVVEVKDGDARKLEFGDATFDVVLSSWAIHNIYDASERAAAIREIVRVIKPGGRAVIVDIQRTAEYAEVLKECGMEDVKRTGPNFLFVIPTFVLSARKPEPR